MNPAKELLNKYGLPSDEKYGKNDILFIVESEIKEQLNKIGYIINIEQFKGTRGYSEGCCKSIEALLRYIKERSEE